MRTMLIAALAAAMVPGLALADPAPGAPPMQTHEKRVEHREVRRTVIVHRVVHKAPRHHAHRDHHD